MTTATAVKQPKAQTEGANARFTVVVPTTVIEVLSNANIDGLNFRQLSQLAIREFAERIQKEAQQSA